MWVLFVVSGVIQTVRQSRQLYTYNRIFKNICVWSSFEESTFLIWDYPSFEDKEC